MKIPSLILLAALLVVGAAASPVCAQSWPSRPIRMIVPTGPGLGTDILARLLADGISRTLVQQVYVENVPGASGILGAQAAARAAPDGYTLLLANASTFTSNMFMLKSLPYDPLRDFTPIAMATDRSPFVLSVNPALPVKSLGELIVYGKAQPGKLAYGVDATSGYGIVVGRLINRRAGIGMVEVPYRSTAQLLQDTAAGTIHAMISSFAPVVAFAQAGKLLRIALTSAQRFPGADDIPTVAETVPGIELDGWLVVVAPAGTPPDIVETLNRDIREFLQRPELQQRLNSLGLALSGANTPQTTAQFIAREQAQWRALAQELELKPE